MDVLLIFAFVGAVLLGCVAVSRLDRFFARGGFTKEPDAVVTKEIFLYGAQEVVEALSEDLNRAKITNDWATEPEMNAGVNYHWIGAFSSNDEDNLLACLSAKRNQSVSCIFHIAQLPSPPELLKTPSGVHRLLNMPRTHHGNQRSKALKYYQVCEPTTKSTQKVQGASFLFGAHSSRRRNRIRQL